jgi:hypothetical protein
MRSTRDILKAKERFGDRLIVLSFEALVADPKRAMRLVCQRTGLAWSDRLTEPTFNGMPVLSNSEYEAVSHIDAGAADRYRETIAADVQAEIDALAGPLLAEANAIIGNEFATPREAAIA